MRVIRSLGPTKLALAALDVAVLMAVAATILIVRSELSSYTIVLNEVLFFVAFSFAAVLVFREFHLYRHKVFSTGAHQIAGLAKGMLWVGILQMFTIFLIKDQNVIDYSRSHIVLFLLGGWGMLSLVRLLAYRLVSRRFSSALPATRRVLIVGAGRAGQKLATRIQDRPELGLSIACFIDDDPEKIGRQLFGRKVDGPVSNLPAMAARYGAQEIYIAINSVEYSRLLEIIELSRGTDLPVTVIADHFRIVHDKINTSEFTFIDSLTLRPTRRISPSRTLKLVFDVMIAGLILLLLSPLLLAIAVAVKFSSKGPIFYSTEVVGKDGRLFRWYKFRTMIVNNDSEIHRKYVEDLIRQNAATKKLDRDPRITGVGAILRKYSLDELPQLFNVLRGEMSLIGPRPCLPYEYNQFDDWHRRRFAVTPGMTGLWQVFGRNRSDVSFNDSIILDLYYIQNYSLLLDIKIFLKTIPVVLFGRGGA